MPPPKPTMSDDLIRSFGRVRGRKLGQEQNFLIEEILPKLALNIETGCDLHSVFGREIDFGEANAPERASQNRSVLNIREDLPVRHSLGDGGRSAATSESPAKIDFCLEIGFGRGEHLAQYAKQNPETSCIGCEPFINGVARLVKYIHEEQIPNIRILHGDARLLLEKLPENILDKVFILFPDPWPKLKHHRKRLVCNETLDALHRVIKADGVLEIATDHVDYGDWIAEHLANHKGFAELYHSTTPPSDWIRTKYQEKAEKEGRGARFFKVGKR